MSKHPIAGVGLFVSALLIGGGASATPFEFSTGNPDGRMASASRPSAGGKFEIESADDFVLSQRTRIDQVSFTGLLTGANPSVGQVRVEIYRVFPNDSDVTRTSGAPTFSTTNVPTRVNSPSDVALQERDSAVPGDLKFTTSTVGTFTANNSVQPGGIHAKPGQTTGGNGAVTGTETRFSVTLTNPIVLPAAHYFFVPQVDAGSGGEFLWLSAPKPIAAPGTPFTPDLQSWTRDEPTIAPDWLRIGTDIVGGTTPPTFNAAFALTGLTVDEPATWLLCVPLSLVLWGAARRTGIRARG